MINQQRRDKQIVSALLVWRCPEKMAVFAPAGRWRDTILRICWDGRENPSVECPSGGFFCGGWNEYHQISSLAICMNPGTAFNCYWPMPFRKHCRMTLENRGFEPLDMYYQIDYVLTQVEDDAAYFHAQFRRVNPLPSGQVYTIVDGVRGKGHYVGTYLAWGVNNNGWWGEGEIKFYMDGEAAPFPPLPDRDALEVI